MARRALSIRNSASAGGARRATLPRELEVPSGGFSTLKVNAGYRFQMGVELYKTRDHTVDDGRHEGDVSSIRYKPMNTYIVRQSLTGRNL